MDTFVSVFILGGLFDLRGMFLYTEIYLIVYNMTQENSNNEEEKSLLSDIIESSKKEQENIAPTERALNAEPIVGEPKKIREPIPPGSIIKAVAALFFTSIIFLAIGLAYIIFNPDEAQIFVRMFGIDIPKLISWLKALVNSTFGILSLGLSIALFISIFRAIWTPREQKRKKTLAIIISILILIFLVTVFSFWMFLVKKIWNTVWDGWVIGIYDNALYSNELWKPLSELKTTQDLIWPITLRYDIRGNAKTLQTNWAFKIERYEIDFDGANCSNGASIITGNNPETEQNIICTFDEVKTYTIRGTYYWKDITWAVKDIPMEIDAVEIWWLLDIREQKNSFGKDIITLDATSLRLIWEPTWTYENGKKVTTSTIFHESSITPIFVQLTVWDMTKRVLMLQKTQSKIWDATIDISPSASDPLDITFSLTGLTIDTNSILGIDWIINNWTVICPNGKDICNYMFNEYGDISIKAVLSLTDKSTHTIKNEFTLNTPLRLVRRALVKNDEWNILNPESTYDPIGKSYVIKNILPPEELIFDARDVVLENPWYRLKNVRWNFDDGKKVTEKVWEQVTFNITNSYRYTITWQYTFEKVIGWNTVETRVVQDSFVVDVEYKNLIPQIDIIKQTSTYVPSSITVDGSQSWSESSEIIKFIYNFWEWRIDTVGDAIQTYEYTTPWEKTITLTIVDSNWEQAQIKKTIVLKEAPRIISFVPSISPWIIWLPIDFTVSNWWWQIESYLWTFWDNTPSQRWETVTHVFGSAWEYKITLTATYSDGTQQQATSTYRVVTELE